MATTSTAPFPRLHAPARSNPAARPSLSTRGPPTLSFSRSIISVRRRLAAASKDTASDKEQEQEPSTAAGGAAKPTAEETPESVEKTQEEVAAELKEVMRARKDAEAASGGGGWWAGVTQEMSEIEWPAPGKVLGTTGVVLGIIAGSTAALLSVNAVLAELSDRVFAGRGLQDFF
jgi:preprotein translocase subunit SecE